MPALSIACTPMASTSIKTDVTNAQFAAFGRATGYVTVAECTPRAEDFPSTPPENLWRDMSSCRLPIALSHSYGGLMRPVRSGGIRSVRIAPSGAKTTIPSFKWPTEDAVAYARCSCKRLRTEAEREFAARGGPAGKPFVWGDEFRPNGKWMANTHQGSFPDKDEGWDGFSSCPGRPVSGEWIWPV